MNNQNDLNPLAWLFWAIVYGLPIAAVLALVTFGFILGRIW